MLDRRTFLTSAAGIVYLAYALIHWAMIGSAPRGWTSLVALILVIGGAQLIVIGVLGDDPFEGFLDQTIRGEHVRGRGFQLQRYRSVGEIKTCHILFISRATGARLDEVLANLRNRPILTVSDDTGFAERGGMIRFVTDQNRIRLQINLDAAQAASLTVSSKLLRVADIVTPQGR